MQNIYAYGRIMAGDEDGKNRLNIIRDMQVPEEHIFLIIPPRKKEAEFSITS